MRSTRLAALVLAAVLQLSSCKDDAITQIVVVVDSDYDGFERVEIAVEGFTTDVDAGANVADAPLPRRLTLVHDGGPRGPLAVTVTAFVANEAKPAIVEHRVGIFFERDAALMLKVDLFFACIGKCDDACLEGAICVSAAEATELTAWDADYEPLGVRFHLDGGASVDWRDGGPTPVAPDAGPSDDGGPGAGDDGGDAGPSSGGSSGGGGGGEGGEGGEGGSGDVDGGPDLLFPFEPTNFDPEIVRGLDLMPVTLDCSTAIFDSTSLTFTDWCGAEPLAMVVEQSDDSELVVLAMSSLNIEAGATLRLVGARPVALVALGDASVLGAIDASASGATSGGGGLATCPNGASTGTNETIGAAGGGSGGGFGTAGGAGGAAYSDSVHVSGGTVAGSATLSPLRGGCPGGAGGDGSDTGGAGGGAGGAFQLTVAGELAIAGELLASGGGGQAGADFRDGGGGGGSGGAILLEASSYALDAAVVIAANGGSGAAGHPSVFSTADSESGADGPASSAAAAGGAATGSGGDGGAGASLLTESEAGADGTTSVISGGGGGGGGGGVGRIRLQGAASCVPTGVLSPQPSVACPSCAADCPDAPEHGCVGAELDATFYYVCHPIAPFAEARSNCSDAAMTLVRIDDQAENDWLCARGLDELWIGATDSATEEDWRWVQGDTSFWLGDESGSAVGSAFTGWQSSEPSGSGDAAILHAATGQWSDQSDADDYGYVCEL